MSSLLDFFAAAPGLGLTRAVRPMESFDVEFGTAVQRFHIGVGSVAVPGTAAGLGTAHRQFGSLPWSELVAPAAALARSGVVQTAAHARLAAILVPVVTLTPEARAVWAPGGHVLTGARRCASSQLADTLDRLADAGAGDLYRGGLAEAVVAFSDEVGAALTARDLAEFRVIRRRPVGCRSAAPGPHQRAALVGGLLLAYGLALHDRLPVLEDPLGAAAVRTLAAILRETEARRGRELAAALRRSGARRLLEDPVARARPGEAARRPACRAASRWRRGGSARHEPHLGRRRRRQRGCDDELDRLRLGRVRR